METFHRAIQPRNHHPHIPCLQRLLHFAMHLLKECKAQAWRPKSFVQCHMNFCSRPCAGEHHNNVVLIRGADALHEVRGEFMLKAKLFQPRQVRRSNMAYQDRLGGTAPLNGTFPHAPPPVPEPVVFGKGGGVAPVASTLLAYTHADGFDVL